MEERCARCGMLNKPVSRFCSGCGFELNKPQKPVINKEEIEVEYYNHKKKRKRSNLAGAIVGIMFFLLTGIAAYSGFKGGYIQQAYLEYTCKQFDKQCPMMINQDVRLEGVEVLSGKVVQYKYTLINVLKEEVNTDTLALNAAPEIIKGVKQDPQLSLFRNLDATLSYLYNDRLGIFVWKFDVTPAMYK